MEAPIHTVNALFKQLGLGSAEQDIDRFIERNSPLRSDVEIHEAKFWTQSQAALLKELKDNDADWAEVVDQLSARLR